MCQAFVFTWKFHSENTNIVPQTDIFLHGSVLNSAIGQLYMGELIIVSQGFFFQFLWLVLVVKNLEQWSSNPRPNISIEGGYTCVKVLFTPALRMPPPNCKVSLFINDDFMHIVPLNLDDVVFKVDGNTLLVEDFGLFN